MRNDVFEAKYSDVVKQQPFLLSPHQINQSIVVHVLKNIYPCNQILSIGGMDLILNKYAQRGRQKAQIKITMVGH